MLKRPGAARCACGREWCVVSILAAWLLALFRCMPCWLADRVAKEA